MIRRNYYIDNVSIGFGMDFEMGWQGYPSMYKDEIYQLRGLDKRGRKIKQQQAKQE